jgi:NodT family efflux transporter outer membrane factor (OMF) lipoprotein
MTRPERTSRSRAGWTLVILLGLGTPGCIVGPNYAKPAVPSTNNYREQLPAGFKEEPGWKLGEPKDDELKGKWWEIFHDPALNALEEQIHVSSPTLAQAEAQFRASRAAIRVARATLYPAVTGGVSVSDSRSSANRPGSRGVSAGNVGDFQLPVDASWEPDIWGLARRTIESNVASAQAAAATIEATRLTIEAEVALDYFQLHGLDADRQLLDSNVVAYQRALDLTNSRFNQGVASQVDVAQAQTQLETTRAESTDTQVARAQFEHAIAILIGKPPSELEIPLTPITAKLPAIPVALPSELLERRPDIAASERKVAAANALIGVAKASYYPTVALTGALGLEGSSLLNWFQWPSTLYSIGSSLTETLYDAGKRRGLTMEAQANYDATVEAYRETVLTAFQDVEDNLAALRILDQESTEQARAVQAAEHSLQLANFQYVGGITNYLQVIVAQAVALTNERTAVALTTRRMTAAVSLVKALGGGWNVSGLPTSDQLLARQVAAPGSAGAAAGKVQR